MSKKLTPIAWMEGMFLRPHHFQHHDLFQEERLHYHLRAVDPYHWGVRELSIDEEALSDHRVSITRLEAVLPTGMLIRHPGNATVETRQFDPRSEVIDVYVGVRHWSPGDANSSIDDESQSNTRYVLRNHQTPDLQRGGYEAELTLAHPNVRVFLAGEENQRELHDSFRIAQIRATGEQTRPFEINPHVAPPLLAVQAWNPLFDQVAQIVNQMAARIRVVVGRTTTYSNVEMTKYFTRYTLARLTPVLRHYLSTGFTRPFDLYMALLEAASALSTFQTTEAVEFPSYQHDDPMGCFEAVIQTLGTHLEGEVQTRFTELKLEWIAQERIYGVKQLNTEQVSPNNHVFIGVKAAMDAKELAKWVADTGRAGSIQNLNFMRITNQAGLPIEHLPGPPTEISGRIGFEYFRIETRHERWDKVTSDYNFGIDLGQLEGADVRLYFVSPEG